jgi:hypothetical protein
MHDNGKMYIIFSALTIIWCKIGAMATFQGFNFKSPTFL